MRTVNLKSLIDIYDDNKKKIPQEYIDYIGEDYNLEIKKDELEPLKELVEKIEQIDKNIALNNFYLGYKIPQIGKEFDLLKITDKSVLNIEYKRKIPNIEKIKKQLVRNSYYLSFLNKEMILIGYIQEEDNIYILKDGQINKIEYNDLIDILKSIEKEETIENSEISKLFKVSNYLISPFNKTEKFIEGKYFLTEQQEEIKREIINNKIQTRFLIHGSAGTGKSLLVYDISKSMMNENKNVILFHCGILNQGHYKLKEEYRWKIYAIKNFENALNANENVQVIIVDEVQRIKIDQFEKIKKFADEKNIILICSGDKKQIINDQEGQIVNVLDEKVFKRYNLTNKIRTNKEVGSFIRIMLDLNDRKNLDLKKLKFDNINIVYFKTYEEANEYITTDRKFKFISFTPSKYTENQIIGFENMCQNVNAVGNSHEVIGQEFENVSVMVNDYFYYDLNDGKLKSKKMDGNVYPAINMFKQGVTRVINNLEIIVINNLDVFNKLIEITQKKFIDKNN